MFLSYPSPRLLLAQWLVFLALRIAVGEPSAGELWIVGGVAAWWPLQEWTAHRWLLHLRPRVIRGRRFDPLFARAHRSHHRAPWDLGRVFLPLRVLVPLMPVHAATWLFATDDAGAALTGMLAFGGAALLYEWVHFLTHTSYAPRSAYFRAVRRGHRAHHFKSERFWFAFTAPWIDRCLGTAPDPRAVERSETARTLGVEEP